MAGQFSLRGDRRKKRRIEADEESYDPKAKEPARKPVEVKGFGTLKKGDDGIRETIRGAAFDAAGKLGLSRTRQQYLADKGSGLVDFIPGVGDAVAAKEVGEDLGKGNYGSAAINTAALAMGLIPGAGDLAAKGFKKGAKELTEAASQFALKPEKRKAITATSLRQMPLDEAITQARTGEHIIPAGAGKREGAFVGAPYAAGSMDDIEELRRKFDADVIAGAEGADWYPRAQEWIKQMAGPDPAAQSELARNLALFSAQADPKGNLGFSVQARNNAIMGMTPTSSEGKEGVVRTGQQWDTYKKAYDTGDDIKLGAKTGVYSDHMDPTRTNPTTGTNDIWHARALGYTEPEITGGLSPQKHSWMDAETVLGVDRANQGAYGGRSDWTPGEVQAAPWVTGKGRGLQERRGMTQEEGIAEASKTYPDYAPGFTANATHEMTPGRQTGHLPAIANADQATRDAFAAGPGNWWQGDDGSDVLYRAQGAYTAPSREATGIYGDPVQFNPMQNAQPLASMSGPTGERVVDAASQQMMTGTEGFRAMMDAQDAGAWSMSIPGQKVSHNNAMDLRLNGEPSREGLAEIMGIGGEQGLGDTIHYGGPSAMLTEFWPGKTGIGGKDVKAMNQALGGRATATPTHRSGDYVGYGDTLPDGSGSAWSGGAAEGAKPIEGTDRVTNMMLSKLNAAQEKALDKPEVRAKVLERFDRDAAVALERGDVVREDLQRARKFFAEGGFKLLREKLGQGLLPAAAAGIFLTRRDDEEA